MALLGPEGFFPVGVRIHDVEVQVGRYLQNDGLIGSDFVGNRRDLIVHDAEEALGFDPHTQAVGQGGGEGSAQEALVHIELAVKVAHLCSGGQIQDLAVDADVNADEVDRIEDFGEVLGVAVLPPTHFGLVGIVHAGDVRALQVLAGEAFFVVGALAHAAVAQSEEGFGEDLVLRIPGGFRQLPGVGVDRGLHQGGVKRGQSVSSASSVSTGSGMSKKL